MAEHLLLSHNFSSPIAGRLVKKSGAVGPEYHVNDYLCSVRVVTDYMGRVLERNDYSGFGKRLASSTGSANRYRFSGKEEQGFAGLPWQDFGARMYDPDLARWTTQDPLADQYPGISPYAYCNNNPVNFVDPDGRLLEDPIRNPEIRRNRASNLYGKDIRFNGTQYRNHQGFDYYAPEGTDVMSVKDGVVINIVEGHKDYGNSVTIEHINADNSKVYSFYAHLSEINVAVNDAVKEGQIIAKTGITGNASNLKGADQHLHFELRSQPENASGLTGKMDPNEIVDTKFESQNPYVKPQTNIGIIKINKDGTKEYLEIIR